MHEFGHWMSSEEIRSSIGIQKFPPFAKPFTTSSPHPRPRHPQVRYIPIQLELSSLLSTSRVGEVIPLGKFFHSHLHIPEKACTWRLIIYWRLHLVKLCESAGHYRKLPIAFAIHQYDPGRRTSFLSTSARRVEITIRLREMDEYVSQVDNEKALYSRLRCHPEVTLPI